MDSLQWQGFLKSCLDILRNGESKFDGLKAINEFIALITLKLVEYKICDFNDTQESSDSKINIGLDCKFTNLYNTYCIFKNDDDKIQKAKDLFDILYNIDRNWDFEDEIDDNLNHISQMRKKNNKLECIIERFGKYTKNLHRLTDNIIDIKTITSFTKHHCRDVQKLVSKIHEIFNNVDINTFTYDAFGNAYEKMIADELSNSSKRNGQYFTKRELISYIINELNITSNDICYDPACGTGGFLLGFKNVVNSKKFIKHNIYGQEYLDEVYKILNFNMLANNCERALEHITRGDSIRLTEKNYHDRVKNKFDVVGANPPFGVSIETRPEEYPIQVKNSVACFLQHIYFSLKDGGRAGVVIDRGILNNGGDKKNSWETKLRKFLLEKTSITKIVNLPTGIFKYTNFATSVIFFTKGTPTTEISYIEGYFKQEDKGKGDKTLYFKEPKMLSIENIKEKNYSLKYDDYFNISEEIVISDKWIKLGDICSTRGGIKHKLEEGITDEPNDYIYLRGQNVQDKYMKVIDFKYLNKIDSSYDSYKIYIGDLYYILVGNVGTCGISNVEGYMSGNLCSLYNFENYNFNKFYVMYFLIFNKPEPSTNAQPNISRDKLKNIKIPNLSLEHQEEIVNFLDEIYEKVNIEDTNKYLKDKPIFNLLINRNYEGFKTVIFLQENIPKLMSELENISMKKTIQVQSIFESYKNQSRIKLLSDISDITFGTRITKANNSIEKTDIYNYPVYGGGGITFYTDTYNRDNETIIISRFGVSPSCVRIIKDKFFLNDSGLSIKSNSLNNNFLKYYLYYNQLHIYNNYTGGQSQQNLIVEKFKNEFKIPVPSLEVQSEIIEKIKLLEDKTSHYNVYEDILKKELDNISEIIDNMV